MLILKQRAHHNTGDTARGGMHVQVVSPPCQRLVAQRLTLTKHGRKGWPRQGSSIVFYSLISGRGMADRVAEFESPRC